METCQERIGEHISKLSNFNATPGSGVTRFSYSREYLEAGDYLTEQLKGLGLEVRIDPVGNIRARLEGSQPGKPVVLTGSHLDTVFHGGKYDGTVGVVGGLEALNVLVENGVKPLHSIELIVFVEEEGSRFNAPLAGSKFITGEYTPEDLRTFRDDRGISMYEAAAAAGLNPGEAGGEMIRPGEVKAMVELHVEQGAVLDKRQIPVGLVQAVAGMKWVKVTFEGTANHAGTTPMEYRQDPMPAAAAVILALPEIVKESPFSTTVGTVGRINCYPNKANVIPEKVELILDIRDVREEGIAYVLKRVEDKVAELSRPGGLKSRLAVQGKKEAITLNREVVDTIEEVIRERGIPYLKMNSGALHDTSSLSRVAPSGMIFVPSKNGLSHTPEEETALEEIKKGCDVLLGSLLKLSGSSL